VSANKTKRANTGQESAEKLISPEEAAKMLAVEFPQSRVTLRDNKGEIEFQSIPGPDDVQ